MLILTPGALDRCRKPSDWLRKEIQQAIESGCTIVPFRSDTAEVPHPALLPGDPNFGVAVYGRQGRQSGFPAVTPFNETARQIQLIFRVEF